MPRVKEIQIKDFTGGLSSNDDSLLDDNQLKAATNVYYDQNGVLTSRLGSSAFGLPIPDTVVLIDELDSITNFTTTGDMSGLAAGTAIRGTNSLDFDVTFSGGSATLTNNSLSVDASAASAFFTMWVFAPTGLNTDLTSIKLRLGTDSSNYHEFTLPTLVEGENNFVRLDIADAVEVGTNDWADITYFRLQLLIGATFPGVTSMLINSLYGYSGTSTKEIHSIDEHETSTGTKYLIAGCGENLFLYNAATTAFEVIKTGLTDGTKFSSDMFKDVIYITSPEDNYMSFDGIVVTEHASVPQGRYLIVKNDVGFLAGEDGARSTIYYTNSNPTDLTDFPNNETVDEDNGEVITGLTNIGALILATKERSSYIFNVATPSIEEVDYSTGCTSGRTIAKVENDIYFLGNDGIVSLAQRQGTSGTIGGTTLSDSIRSLISGLSNTNIAAAIYWPRVDNYYIAVDEAGSGKPNAMYVFSRITRGWTKYTGVQANDFAIHRDANDVEHLLCANPYGGQMIEMETGFDDLGTEIPIEIQLKAYDFGSQGTMKFVQRADVEGYHSQQSSVNVTVQVTNIKTQDKTKIISYNAATDTPSGVISGTLGSQPLGKYPLAGGGPGGGSLDMHQFIRHMPLCATGREVRLTLSGSLLNSSFQLTKVNVWPVALPSDFAPTAQYI